MNIIESNVAISTADGSALADRIIEIRDQSHSPEVRLTMLNAANLIRKAVPALIVSETVMKYCIETLSNEQLSQLRAALAVALAPEEGE